MSNIGYATLSVIPSARGFGQALRNEVSGDISAEGEKAGGAFGNNFLSGLKNAGIIAGVTAFATATKGVFAAIDFDQSMREVFTLMPEISGEAMTAMSNQVKDFSIEFGVLPNDVIPALYQAISAGVPSGNVFEFLETAQMAAKGGVTELTTAVDGISSVVNAYGADVMDATQASDLMFTAVRLGKTDFEQLSSSLFQVTPTASALGVGFGDVTAALAALTAQGVPTSVATTQMRQLFIELSKEGGKASGVFEDMAGKTFKEFIAEGGNTAEALDLMLLASQELGVGVNDLFGSVEAGSAALALAGSEVFVDNIEAMGDATGATSAAFDMMNQGLRPMIDRFKAWGQVMLINIGERVIPIIETAVRVVGDAITRVSGWLTQHRPILIGVITAIGAGVVAMFTAWAISAGAAAIATLAAAAPFIALGAAIAAVVAAVIYAYQEWDWFRDAVDAVWQWIQNTLWPGLQNLATWLKDAFVAAWGAISTAIEAVWDWLQDMWDRSEAVRAFLASAFKTALDAVVTAFGAVRTAIETVWNWVQTVWDRSKEFRGFLVDAFKTALDVVVTAFGVVRDAIETVWNWTQTLWDRSKEFRGFLEDAFKGALNIVKDAFNAIRESIETVWDWVLTLWNRSDGLRGFFMGLFKLALDTIVAVFTTLWGTIETVWDWVLTVWDELKGFREFLAGVFKGAVDTITTAIGSTANALLRVWSWANSAWNALKRFLDLAGEANPFGGGSLWGSPFAFSGNTPENWRGVRSFQGGLSWVGERGPELVNMPRGTTVHDARSSERLAAAQGAGGGITHQELTEVLSIYSKSTERMVESTVRRALRAHGSGRGYARV